MATPLCRFSYALIPLLLPPLGCGCERRTASTAPTSAPAGAPAEGQVRWVDPKQAVPGPVLRDALTAEQVARMDKVRAALKEVDRTSRDQWVDNFKRDANPDRELEIWENIAAAYTAYTRERALSQQAKEDVYGALLLRSMAPAEEVLPRLKLKALTPREAEDVMALYDAPANPPRAVQR